MKLNVIIPLYNEENNIMLLFETLTESLKGIKYSLIFVDDGSTDKSLELLTDIYKKNKSNVKVISFSRNFGKEAAMFAGLKNAKAEYTCIIDADLQQNPKYIVEMLNFLEDNHDYDEVAMVNDYSKEKRSQRFMKRLFYKIMSKKNLNKSIIGLIFTALVVIVGYFTPAIQDNLDFEPNQTASASSYRLEEIPEYINDAYVVINDNKPFFEENEYTTESFEKYSQLDILGRCGVAYANICKEIIPPEGDKRGDISSVTPTGWKQKQYNGSYLYNRCHLIGYQLSDEDANELNLITGTRYFNVTGMLPFENQVADYLKINKDNHVLYRVTPIYEGNNLLASGVEMEAYSVEDNGEGVCFNVYVYNVQPRNYNKLCNRRK